jgi:hypothetical protein
VKDRDLDKLIRKATGQSSGAKSRRARFVDPTLEATKRPDEEEKGDDSIKLFKEMKRREF